ncbi:GNAT family N-acetyltransferase [Streptomyces sp. NPDC059740]|uniref:GNAT family N-acetyltransferase n=1 Tax=Streptomyces sp. NPDC059740 TaxID=3346926 RepID=UPI0036672CE6
MTRPPEPAPPTAAPVPAPADDAPHPEANDPRPEAEGRRTEPGGPGAGTDTSRSGTDGRGREESGAWSVAAEPPGSPTAAVLWREYCTEVADRWYLLHLGRRGTPEEITSCLAAESGEELAHPHGELLVARRAGRDAAGGTEVAGCAGVRLPGPGTAELTRVYVRPVLRRSGAGRALVAAAEVSARRLGAHRLRLDTRLDLVEALALYRHCGFVEIPAYNAGPYAETWWEKPLG